MYISNSFEMKNCMSAYYCWVKKTKKTTNQKAQQPPKQTKKLVCPSLDFRLLNSESEYFDNLCGNKKFHYSCYFRAIFVKSMFVTFQPLWSISAKTLKQDISSFLLSLHISVHFDDLRFRLHFVWAYSLLIVYYTVLLEDKQPIDTNWSSAYW